MQFASLGSSHAGHRHKESPNTTPQSRFRPAALDVSPERAATARQAETHSNKGLALLFARLSISQEQVGNLMHAVCWSQLKAWPMIVLDADLRHLPQYDGTSTQYHPYDERPNAISCWPLGQCTFFIGLKPMSSPAESHFCGAAGALREDTVTCSEPPGRSSCLDGPEKRLSRDEAPQLSFSAALVGSTGSPHTPQLSQAKQPWVPQRSSAPSPQGSIYYTASESGSPADSGAASGPVNTPTEDAHTPKCPTCW